MKTGTIALMLIGAFAWPLAGCHSPTRVADSVAMKRHSMPDSWVYESSRSGKVKALPRALRNRLETLRADMVVEQGTRYFSFYGHYTPEMQSRIDTMNAACTESYLVSDRAIASNLTPELQSMTQSEMDLWWSDRISFDIQRREFVDDWRSLWMIDSPSILNRLPIVDTAHP
jgi:hypothetical protein